MTPQLTSLILTPLTYMTNQVNHETISVLILSLDPAVSPLAAADPERPSLSRQNSGASTSGGVSSSGTQQPADMSQPSLGAAAGSGPPKVEDRERRMSALQILALLCECKILQPHRLDMLAARWVKDTFGSNFQADFIYWWLRIWFRTHL